MMNLDVLSYFKDFEFKKYFQGMLQKMRKKNQEKWVTYNKNRIQYGDNELYPLNKFPSFVVYRIKD